MGAGVGSCRLLNGCSDPAAVGAALVDDFDVVDLDRPWSSFESSRGREVHKCREMQTASRTTRPSRRKRNWSSKVYASEWAVPASGLDGCHHHLLGSPWRKVEGEGQRHSTPDSEVEEGARAVVEFASVESSERLRSCDDWADRGASDSMLLSNVVVESNCWSVVSRLGLWNHHHYLHSTVNWDSSNFEEGRAASQLTTTMMIAIVVREWSTCCCHRSSVRAG